MASWSSCCRGGALAWSMLLLLCAAAALLSTAFAYECDSGILQMKPLPQQYSSCYSGPLDSNSIKAACTAALRVRVKNGIVKIVPLVQETYNYTDAGLSSDSAPSLNCKDLNASGIFYPGSTTSASVMLYDDFGGPLSNLTKTGADTISLIPAHTYSFLADSPNCVYNYTVVQGCVFGVKAPAKPAATCPAGSTKKAGRFGISYCRPCAPGAYYDKSSSTCKPCAIGTYSTTFGSLKCTKCDDGLYANVTGLSQCEYCSSFDGGYYTDGKTCTACPKNSYTSSDIKGQCYRCDAGKRCCTVGWSKSCPKCPAGNSTPKSYSSIFALETATPASCFATGHALCAPKINITVDSTCTISLDNQDNSNNPDDNTYCSWSTSVSVNGSKLSITDIAKFDFYTDNSTLLSGNFTAAASPYLTVSIPDTKCTLRYRALTKPLAALLGAAPKPSKATSCPAGQYLETDTDTKPGPCLRCPPGTYSPRASSGRKCFRCPAGTYTNRYGSTLCKRCTAGRASSPGSAWCSLCDSNTYPLANGKGCKACPKDSETYYREPGGMCLGNAYGSMCCAAGNCTGQPLCKGPRKPTSADPSDTYTAVLQLVSKSLPQPACKNATFLSCLPVNGKVQVYSYSYSPASLYLETYRTKSTCGNYSSSYFGAYSSPSAAYVSAFEEGAGDSIALGLFSDSSKGSLTVYLQPGLLNASPVLSKGVSACSATFKIISGYAFDLTPPKDAKCDPADGEYTYGGRKFCQVCSAGQYKNSTGKCAACPAGTYGDTAGAASCKPCRAGYSCDGGLENTCAAGYFSSKPQTVECSKCPKNTYGSSTFIPTTKCTACPKGTIAPEASTACGVPWDKKFPA